MSFYDWADDNNGWLKPGKGVIQLKESNTAKILRSHLDIHLNNLSEQNKIKWLESALDSIFLLVQSSRKHLIEPIEDKMEDSLEDYDDMPPLMFIKDIKKEEDYADMPPLMKDLEWNGIIENVD